MLQFTEEELGEIIELTEEMCTRNGWVNEIVPPAKKRMEIITRARSRPHPAPANPCEENGCTDIENCDEICEHSRIYSPVQVAEKVKAERVRVLQKLILCVADMGFPIENKSNEFDDGRACAYGYFMRQINNLLETPNPSTNKCRCLVSDEQVAIEKELEGFPSEGDGY